MKLRPASLLQATALLLACITSSIEAEMTWKFEPVSVELQESLSLKEDAMVLFQDLSQNTIQDLDGTEYSVNSLEPMTDFYSLDDFDYDTSGKYVAEKKSGNVMWVSQYMAELNGVEIFAIKEEDNEVLTYVEIRHDDERPTTILSKVAVDGYDVDPYVTYSSNDVDTKDVKLDALSPPNDGDRRELGITNLLRGGNSPDMDRSLQSGCYTFDVAAVYDSEFCASYGSHGSAKAAIADMILGAAVYYKRDLCITLKYKGAESPDNSCSGESNTFSNRGNGCSNFLDEFSTWQENNKGNYGWAPSTVVHGFTGFPKGNGASGCAWVGTVCLSQWGAGVNYIQKDSASENTKIAIVAHELGHNFGADHDPQNSNSDYIMRPTVTSGADRFSPRSASSITNYVSGSRAASCRRSAGSSSSNNSPTPSPTRKNKRTRKPRNL